MNLTYYKLSYRTMQHEGKGDPAGFKYETYLKTLDKSKCMEVVNKYNLELVDTNDPNNWAMDGFVIDEDTLEFDNLIHEKWLLEHAKEDAEIRRRQNTAWTYPPSKEDIAWLMRTLK